MIKRLIVIAFALGAHNAPANAASLSSFAHDAAGRPVLELYPASAVKFNAQGRDLVSATVKETPPENDARGAIDLALIVDCQLRQLAASRIAEVAKDGMPPTTVAGFKASDLKNLWRPGHSAAAADRWWGGSHCGHRIGFRAGRSRHTVVTNDTGCSLAGVSGRRYQG